FSGNLDMSDLVAIAFDKPEEADRVLTEQVRLKKEYLIDLEDAVVVIRQPDGVVNLKQSINLLRIGATSGGDQRGSLGHAGRIAVSQSAGRLCGGWSRGSRCRGTLRIADRLRH